MSLRVAIPVYFATVRLHVEKGRHWNAIEHSLLYAVCEGAQSGTDLAQNSNLPVRLVIEVMIRLMRAGWVELEGDSKGFRFRATSAGRVAVSKETLPAITRPLSRTGSFAIERVTGAVFRARDLILYNRYVLSKLREGGDIVELQPQEIDDGIRQDDIVKALCDEDEQFKRIEATPSRFSDRFAVVSVVGTAVEGLPPRASDALRQNVLEVAKSTATSPAAPRHAPIPYAVRDETEELTVKFHPDGFVVGGREHLAVLTAILKRARQRILIHSTFVDAEKFRSILPLLHDAAKRGVKIDLLWGKGNAKDGTNSTDTIVEACRRLIAGDDVRERITIHGFSTRSHAKLIVADDGKGRFSAVVGSCNWLSTDFAGIEVSVRLEDPTIVGAIVSILCRMGSGPQVAWTALSSELAILAHNLKQSKEAVSGISVVARVLWGGAHGTTVLRARDEAKRRIVITSHRFSQNAETLVLIPARAALQTRDLEVKLYYGMLDGEQAGAVAKRLEERAAQGGVRFQQILEPRLHAKVLAWDDDSVIVTSQNWLSADPPDDDQFGEVGVYLKGGGMGAELIGRLAIAFDRANRG